MIQRVSDIVPEAADMKSLFLEPADGEPLRYEAGQFLTLLFSFQGRELRRSYSFASTPGIDPVPAVCVRRVPNGEISRHLLDHLRVGDLLTTLEPAGRFTLGALEAGNVIFVGAGSGIVPIYSLLKEALALRPHLRVQLLTQQHDVAASPFRAALQGLEASFGAHRLEWTEMLTVRDGRMHRGWLEEWVLARGRATLDGQYYVCGPPDFMRMVQFTLRTLGVAAERIRREHFTVGRIAPAPPVFDATPKRITIRDTEITREFTAVWPESILDAALRQGIALPYSCRAGRCSSCVARCLAGRVRMTNNEVLTENDLREGLVLTCTGYAETDVELSYERSSAPNPTGNNAPERGMT
ncbi:MAG TPA: iron-sulfur cluster-binding domain-containing protein [Puia sp.]|nr:iron-sulfur cluster-binding domain-containing protein [Puia sp.]